MKKILVLHGPNLQSLGLREPALYGTITLDMLHEAMQKRAESASVDLSFFQSNSESELMEALYRAFAVNVDAIIVNAAAFSHTSIALRDAFACVRIPFIEVHITNIYARETFRHHSWLASLAKGVICGLGVRGYLLALEYFLEEMNERE
jgi:3-dehydroquinate dehydratase-2